MLSNGKRASGIVVALIFGPSEAGCAFELQRYSAMEFLVRLARLGLKTLLISEEL